MRKSRPIDDAVLMALALKVIQYLMEINGLIMSMHLADRVIEIDDAIAVSQDIHQVMVCLCRNMSVMISRESLSCGIEDLKLES